MKQRIQAALFTLRQIGLTGYLGLVLTLGAALYAAIYAPSQQAERETVRDDISRAQQRRLAARTPSQASQAKAVSSYSPNELPASNATPDALLNLDALARKHKIQLSRYAYTYVERTQPDRLAKTSGKDAESAPRQAPVLEVRIAVPVAGDYLNIRAFVAQALENRPTLVLDSLLLNRELIGQSNVQGQLRFTLFVRRNG